MVEQIFKTIPGGGDVTIDKEGQIFQGDQNIGKVGVFSFENPLLDLQKVGGGFVAKDPEVARTYRTYTIHRDAGIPRIK